MFKLIATIIGLLGGIGKFLMGIFSEKKKMRKKAVKDGKKSVDDNDTTGITSAFSRLRK